MLVASAFVYVTSLILAADTNAQTATFDPNPAWKDKDIITPTKERINIARNAIDKAIAMVVDANEQVKLEDGNYGSIGRLFSQMAHFDMLTNQTKYKQRLLTFFPQAEKFRPGFAHAYMNYGLSFSIAAAQAFRAYSDRSFLAWAELAWQDGEKYTLKEDELQTGRTYGKNITISPECNGLSTAGSTFWRNATDDSYVNSPGTGSFLIASSMLAETTRNLTYADFGLKSRQFYLYHLRNPKGTILNGKHLDDCSPGTRAYSASSGIMIEGLAVLVSVSNQDTADISSELLEIVNNTVSNATLHSQEGILSADTSTGSYTELVGQYIVRGLAAIYNRNATRSSLRTFIREYLGVQYNAVLNNARGQGSDNDTYSIPWTSSQGPSSSRKVSLDTQVNALTMLVAGIPIQNDPSDSPGEPEPPVTNTESKGRPPNRGAIVGAVLGGLATVCLLTVLALWLVRRTRRSTKSANVLNARPDPTESAEQNQIEPFTATEKHVYRDGSNGEWASKDCPPPPGLGSRDLPDFSSTYLEDTNTSTDSSQAPLSMVSTAEIFSLLNRRLRGVEWPEDEQPPDYISRNPPSSDRSTG
ncbi:hypothetical protein AAF712_000916 [Marasmius tenuissimus]|uniref:Glycoside hydrolase family 76 protein n=1 Tax=Marasmius tenuissimus TaxID=585030 RepID=A0ABR3AEH9_9AGAR|nr:hypothetical protein PM082_002794 [Marasmius tenuissimus]